MLSYSVDFKAPHELWNPLSKAVPNKFHGSGAQSKCNCLQDQANSHRSQAWQIVLIFNIIYMCVCDCVCIEHWIQGLRHLQVYWLLHMGPLYMLNWAWKSGNFSKVWQQAVIKFEATSSVMVRLTEWDGCMVHCHHQVLPRDHFKKRLWALKS